MCIFLFSCIRFSGTKWKQIFTSSNAFDYVNTKVGKINRLLEATFIQNKSRQTAEAKRKTRLKNATMMLSTRLFDSIDALSFDAHILSVNYFNSAVILLQTNFRFRYSFGCVHRQTIYFVKQYVQKFLYQFTPIFNWISLRRFRICQLWSGRNESMTTVKRIKYFPIEF